MSSSTAQRGGPGVTPGAAPPKPVKHRGGIRGREGIAGWLFMTPVIVILGLFLLLPIIAAIWVSLADWTGNGSPLHANFVGATNYEALLTKTGLSQKNLATSLRNNFYYVILVVPIQTVLALFLASVLNGRRLKGKGFFRTAFYFPSVTSTVAIMTVFLFLFSASGVVNHILSYLGINGPAWFNDPRGVLRLILSGLHIIDTDNPPAALTAHGFLGLSWYDWLSGPSIAMCALIILAVWTTGGTFMLMFLAALQDIPDNVLEAATVDGATRWQSFRTVTLPALRPTLFLVITLGLIGTWQVFDQIYILGGGNPAKTTLTPAYLSYQASFGDGKWGQGAAISFILFAIIIVMTIIQRLVMRERRTLPRRRRFAAVPPAGNAPETVVAVKSGGPR
jgi:multiple sugar transport system permease protein